MPAEVNASTVGDSNQPSPAIWSDCRNTLLNDLGLGSFVENNFRGDYPTSPGIATDADTGTTYLQGATATYGPHVVAVLNTNTDNNAAALFTAALGKVVRNSGSKMWAEARIAPGALGDSAFAFGLTTLANSTRDVIADNPSNAARAGLTAATFIGFVSVQASSALAKVNVVYAKAAGTPVDYITDVGNSTAFTAGGYTAPGNLAVNTFVKYGLRFDGYKYLYFYVNGVQVGRKEVDSTIDQATDLAVVYNQKTGAATQIVNYLDFIRAGFQERA